MSFLSKNKGYLIHAAAVAVVFLSPSVQAWAVAHQGSSATVMVAWGFLLHYFDGK
jgi:hypothetical protein